MLPPCVLDEASARIVAHFVREDGTLHTIPSKRSKRLVVLDHLAQAFEPGRTYPEAEVSAALRAYHPDHAALRRYLVEEELLTREGGVYWRTGGTFAL